MVKKKEFHKYPIVRRSWKGYDFGLIAEMSEDGLIRSTGRTAPLLITPEGINEAQRLLKRYGIHPEEGADTNVIP